MITTRDRTKVGRTTYHASAYRWAGDDHDAEPVNVANGEYKTLPAAKLAARSWLRQNPTWFTICRGTYEAEDIPDHEYGVIEDADWVEDERWIVQGEPDGNGGIEWVEESW